LKETHYQILPPIYDRWQKTYGKDYSTLILPRVLSSITANRIPKSTMLDLACGTGTLAMMMAKRGWKVWGVDASEGMIAEANEKSRGTKAEVKFLCQDMRKFRLPAHVALVTSLFDSINHITSKKELQATFRRVHACLVRGGYFLFDLNNEHCFKTIWTQNSTIGHKDFTMAFRNNYNSRTHIAKCVVSIKMHGSHEHVPRVETVTERWYPENEIACVLELAGFHIRQVEDFNFTDRPEVGKIKTWWVVQK
jgi:SAM-dependent methyltransferase